MKTFSEHGLWAKFASKVYSGLKFMAVSFLAQSLFGTPASFQYDASGNLINAQTGTATLTAYVTTGSSTISSGDQFLLSAVVTRATGPVSYQWKLNGTDVSGATNATLFLPGVASGNAGAY